MLRSKAISFPLTFRQNYDQNANTTEKDDICTEEELISTFNNVYNLVFEEFNSSKSTYVLHLCGNLETSVAAGLSDNTIKIFDVEGRSSNSFLGHNKSITGLRFSPKSSHLLYSSSLDGSIKLWDIRVKDKIVAEFKGNWKKEDGTIVENSISAFDVCNRDRILVGGTECVLGESFLLFWDVRAPGVEPIGGYWESHTEDITQVKFHESQSDTLATGSMDGLINIFDIRQSCEDDAFTYSLNTESTVDKLTWLNEDKIKAEDKEGANSLSCITHEETLQLWKIDEASPTYEFSRSDIAEALKVKTSEDCYIVDVFIDRRSEENSFVLCGSTKGECLRMLCINDGVLKPWAWLRGTKQVVRCCWSNPTNGLIATGGQSGVITFWRPVNVEKSDESEFTKDTHKIRVKKRSTKNMKPY